MIDVGRPMYFACDECPIVDELGRRTAVAQEHPEWGGFQFDHCGCDKVEDEFFMSGYCEDAWAPVPRHKGKGARRTGRAYRRKMGKQKFARQEAIIAGSNSSALWSGYDKKSCPNGSEYDNAVAAYIKRPGRFNAKKFYKKYSNHVVRRNKLAMLRGGQYRKMFGLRRTIY